MIYNKFNIIVLLVLLFCLVTKVHSKDDAKEEEPEKVTVYVTVPANSTNTEEPTETTVVEEEPTQTVDVNKIPEYMKFEEALQQTEDQCMKHVYVVSLNLFYANQIGNVDCENGHLSSLESLRKAKPCKSSNLKLQYAIDYMDANFRLLCHTRSTGTLTYEGKMEKELCPIIKYIKTNYTKYENEFFETCTTNDTCVTDMLKNYKEIQEVRKKLSSLSGDADNISYKINGGNETVTVRMNLTDSFFNQLEKKCPSFKSITSDALSLTLSFSTIFIFTLFMIFIGRM